MTLAMSVISVLLAALLCMPNLEAQIQFKEPGQIPFNKSLLVDYAKYRNNVNKLRTITIVRSEPDISAKFEMAVQKELLIPMLVITGEEPSLNLRGIIGENSMAYVFLCRALYFADVNVVDFGLRGRHIIPIFFSLLTQPNPKELMQFFEWCLTVNILNMVATFKANGTDIDEVYTYTPYPLMRVINLTGSPYTSYYWKKTIDVQGYIFKVSIFQDPPIVYKLPDDPPHVVRGPSGFLFNSFVKHVNGTGVIVVSSSGEKEMIFSASKKKSHFGINLVPFDVTIANQTAISFPVMTTEVCVIVPILKEMSKRFYFIHTFTTSSWILLLCSAGGVFCLFAYLNWLYSNGRNISFGLTLIFTCRTMLYVPIELPNQRIYNVFIFFLMFLGLFWTSAFIASFTALLSSGIPGKQIRTVDDFLNSALLLNISEYEKFVFFESGLLPRELMTRLLVTSNETEDKEKPQISGTAYVITRQKWQIYNSRQLELKRQLFRVASKDMCSSTIQQAWSIEYDSPFAETLEIMISNIAQSGLYGHEIIKAKFDFSLKSVEGSHCNPTPLTLEYYTFIFSALGILLLISLIAFCIELFIWLCQK